MRRKVKVLQNEYQSSLDWFFDSSIDHIHGTHTLSPAVFNRVGWYKEGKDCWLEYHLKDGSFVSVRTESLAHTFDHDMDSYSDDIVGKTDADILRGMQRRGIDLGPHVEKMLNRQAWSEYRRKILLDSMLRLTR